MVIDSSGNVGIGTVSPNYKLHVVGDGLITDDLNIGTPHANENQSSTLYLNSSFSGTYDFITLAATQNNASQISRILFKNRYDTGDFSNGQEASYIASERQSSSGIYDLTFGVASANAADATEKMRIDHLGNVGIGTTTPSYTLHTQGTIYASSRIGAQAVNTSYLATLGGSSDAKLVLTGSSSPYIRFQEGTTNRAYIQWLSTTDSLKFQNQQGDYFDFSTHDEGSIGLRLMGYSGAIWGYVYANSSSEGGKNIGLLDGGGSWAIRHVENTKTEWRIDNDIKMTLLASGNVGIGTTNPEAGLHIYGSGQQSLFVGSSNGARALLELDGAANGDGSTLKTYKKIVPILQPVQLVQ
jgi:hypothetical protein